MRGYDAEAAISRAVHMMHSYVARTLRFGSRARLVLLARYDVIWG